jgi:hypothetical protein
MLAACAPSLCSRACPPVACGPAPPPMHTPLLSHSIPGYQTLMFLVPEVKGAVKGLAGWRWVGGMRVPLRSNCHPSPPPSPHSPWLLRWASSRQLLFWSLASATSGRFPGHVDGRPCAVHVLPRRGRCDGVPRRSRPCGDAVRAEPEPCGCVALLQHHFRLCCFTTSAVAFPDSAQRALTRAYTRIVTAATLPHSTPTHLTSLHLRMACRPPPLLPFIFHPLVHVTWQLRCPPVPRTTLARTVGTTLPSPCSLRTAASW